MRSVEAARTLAQWNQRGRDVFNLSDLRKMFRGDSDKAFSEGLGRLVENGLLERLARGVYFNPFSSLPRADLLERIAATLRRGEYNYVSLESALSQYGIISQVPLGYLTVMTTGRKGLYRTPYGRIEFTHTARPSTDILDNVRPTGRPLRMATPKAALRDLRRVGRNLQLVDADEAEAILREGSDLGRRLGTGPTPTEMPP